MNCLNFAKKPKVTQEWLLSQHDSELKFESIGSVNFIEKSDLVWWLWHSKDLWNESYYPILAQIHSKSQISPILVALKRRYHKYRNIEIICKTIPSLHLFHHMSPTNSESTNPIFVFTKSFVCLVFCNVCMNKKIRICRFRISCWHQINKMIGSF